MPVLYTELQRSVRFAPRRTQVVIGDSATYPSDATAVRGPIASDGKAADAGSARFARPGLYQVDTPGGTALVAANIDPLESHTAPLALEALEALGVVLEKPDAQSATAVAAAQANERLLKVAEIEGRQKTWAWILAAVLVLLASETVIAGRVSASLRRETAGTATATGATP